MRKWHLTVGWVLTAIPLLAAGSRPALASEPAVASYRVVISDLDLQSASGIDALYARLRAAALTVCEFDLARGYGERHRARRCVSQTLDAVMAEVPHGTSVSRGLNAQHRAARKGMLGPPAPTERVADSVN